MNISQAVWKWDTPGLQGLRSKHVTFPHFGPQAWPSSLSQRTGKMSEKNSLVLIPKGITSDVHLQRALISSLLFFSCWPLMKAELCRLLCPHDNLYRRYAQLICTDMKQSKVLEFPMRIGFNWCRNIFMSIIWFHIIRYTIWHYCMFEKYQIW